MTKQLDAFGARILEENNLFPFNNAGVIIAINKGKKPLLRNIFRLVNFPKKGPRKMKRVVEIRNLDTDEFIKNAPNQHICDENGCRLARPEIDYIHGSAEVFRLGKQENAISILLPPVEKDSFFQTISKTGPLPRKSFSMGEADEKRFYLECRKLFAN